jgi:hypothetical protein
MRNNSAGSKQGPTHIEGNELDYNEKRDSDEFETESGEVRWDARSVLALISLCLLWYVLCSPAMIER